MFPEIKFDFQFDVLLILIFLSYVIYGYFSGGHKQIRLSINLILPFVIIYYMGRYITGYLYIPLSGTFVFEFIDKYLGIMKNTIGMMLAYIFTYVLIFVGIFVISIFARKYVLNENMRAKLGKKNNYLGAVFALINGYVLIYFIILPVFSLNLVGVNAHVTNFVLEHPPPFSRIARTAEKAVPMKDLADKAQKFQDLMSVEGLEEYYNEAIYSYQLQYIGEGSFENDFMVDVYTNLSIEAKSFINTQYDNYFSTPLVGNSYTGISRVLLLTYNDSTVIKELLRIEKEFTDDLEENLDIVSDFEKVFETYEKNLLKYESDLLSYQEALQQFNEDTILFAQLTSEYNDAKAAYDLEKAEYDANMEDFLESALLFTRNKMETLAAGNTFAQTFTLNRPALVLVEPDLVTMKDPGTFTTTFNQTEPVEPIKTQVVIDAETYVAPYDSKVNVLSDIRSYDTLFSNHEGIIVWYVDELDSVITSSDSANLADTINSFKNNYDAIIEKTVDNELKSKLYLAQMSIRSYDVFNLWLSCTLDKVGTSDLDNLDDPSERCGDFDLNDVGSYDFVSNALSISTTLLQGDNITWVIVQYKHDYEAGIFTEYFSDFPEVMDILSSTKELVDEYDRYYKDIASSLEGDISMVFKIGISVMKYNLDAKETLENTPILSAVFNDASRMCTSSNPSPINTRIRVCEKGPTYLVGEVIFKAYLLVDNNNEAIIYDSEKMVEFLEQLNQDVKNNVITQEVIESLGNQLAFHVIDEATNYTLLEQMYDDGQISIEAMRILSSPDYELFSDEFRARVRSLIR